MEGCLLRVYLHESQRCHGRLAWEWLLDQANRLGIRGGSAFRAIGGFGRHHQVQEEHFFELAGKVAVEVEFIVTEEESRKLLDILEKEGLRVVFAHIPARFGVVNPDVNEPSATP